MCNEFLFQDTGSFLAISFGTVLVQIKRNFDKFMQLQYSSIQESKTPRRNKCGILAFIQKFEVFVTTTENIFRGSERRSDLEKWYTILVNEMSSTIVRISREHGKTPQEVSCFFYFLSYCIKDRINPAVPSC